MARIQIITIITSLLFLFYISRLIIKGRLREEYAIVWCVCTLVLVIFSFWRNGLNVMSKLFGVFEPPNLVFTACIFIILIYLLHLSVVASKLHKHNKQIAQELALLKQELKAIKEKAVKD
ncbi:DUF2304 domain-containing protein [Mucilaginibacter boryungensis]|uniref:DUF2304 domain-containing protein n=1 Tax=Mucilaginibacter boryungensis TaxID=768480 RepID=A0ABR9XNA2_9SPHI|nr:DUF2304 domain-containing protein [Mucilaginibacter boryungensis]MBE9668776.1 DUF2304 domain-containing protein [Mucilaginibacter boryungensis]